jgi:multidrug efflux pump subunit AcrA (membrane-fusion protein)
VDVIYSVRNPDPKLRVGALLKVSFPAGPDFSGVIVPAGAIVDDDGRQLAYVQVDGEHFEERAVRVGPRQGGLLGVEHGLGDGERVVVRGAHVVRLAARSGSEQPHGHIH